MERKICKACGVEKDIKSFNKIGNGFLPRCKVCISTGNKIYKGNSKSHQKKRKWASFDDNQIRISNPTKEDYRQMYEFLSLLGYDLKSDKSIHRQFLEKHNLKMKVKSTYKTTPQYLPDGSLNPQWVHKKKKSQPED